MFFLFLLGMAKKHKKLPVETIFIVIAVIAIILVLYLSQKSNTNTSKPVVSVNGQTITTADLDNIALTVPAQQRQSLTKDNLTEIAISNALMMQEAKKRGITVSDAEVNSLIEKFIAQNNLTMQDYEKLLQQQGVDINFIKNVYTEQLMQFKLMNETVLSSVTVSENETKQFYDMYKVQINNTYENSKEELANIIKFQKAQQAFSTFVQQLRANAQIKYY